MFFKCFKFSTVVANSTQVCFFKFNQALHDERSCDLAEESKRKQREEEEKAKAGAPRGPGYLSPKAPKKRRNAEKSGVSFRLL